MSATESAVPSISHPHTAGGGQNMNVPREDISAVGHPLVEAA